MRATSYGSRQSGARWNLFWEHDPEKFSEKIMLKQKDEIMIRFRPIGS
jgi:hypothetical protein